MAANTSLARRAFAEHVVDLLRGLGPVQARAMFGGHGLYLDGLMFALLVDARFFVKVDAETLPVFEAERCPPFVFEAKGRRVALTYHEAPLEALDQPDVAVRWARLGVEAAQRAAVRKGPRGKRGSTVGAGDSLARPSGRKPSQGSGAAQWLSHASGLEALPNLGPRSVQMLTQAGIHSVAQLRDLGAVRAYVQVRAACDGASLNLLWALEGGLSNRPWQVVARDDRASLLMALEDVLQHKG
ncbi:TfoX/Sxy family DNA transformation protein [Aquabacterium sp.]|uniref:TfoX/Sxy family DNA transformation protein n=3 Tax=Aquabacterium sp. TaxID=1872578 RepID=UPI0025C6484B|nr:TfoX/Sxy family DNA transformation protein [Aquabacterium sp.]